MARSSCALSWPIGSANPMREFPKSMTVTKCSRKGPPSTHRSLGGAAPDNRRRSASCAPSEHSVLFLFSPFASQTKVVVQLVPSGFISTISSTCSSPATGGRRGKRFCSEPLAPGMVMGAPPACPLRNVALRASAMGMRNGSGGMTNGCPAPRGSGSSGYSGPPPCVMPDPVSRSPRSSMGSMERDGFGWMARRHRSSPPPLSGTRLKSLSLPRRNPESPRCTHTSASRSSPHEHTTRLPALGSAPQSWSKCPSGSSPRTKLGNRSLGAKRNGLAVSTTKRALISSWSRAWTVPCTAQKDFGEPSTRGSACSHASVPSFMAASGISPTTM
mmetsp:Transcript_68235/g.177597  ORF Transcript_68235/g.177597 Transcript_68235/m.177597 type:complete len:330 (+) Transcript_68235:426-1415(+)